MIVEKSCCYCKHRELKQEQDRADVDIVHFCIELDDWLYADFGRTSDCQSFELHDELKNTASYQMEQIKKIFDDLYQESKLEFALLIFALSLFGVIIINIVLLILDVIL